MTIFRFRLLLVDWRLRLAKLMLSVGFFGFLTCWSIGWNTEVRVFSDPLYASKSATRTEAVNIQAKIYYLEPTFARQFKVSHAAILIFLMIGILGGAYVDHRERKSKK